MPVKDPVLSEKRIAPQKQEGLYAVFYQPAGGMLTPDQAARLYHLIQPMEEVEIRLTPQEGLYVVNCSAGEVREILSAIGISDEKSIRAVYEYIIGEPCNYLKYYLGYLEIEALKERAEVLWSEDGFTLYRFHTFLLNNGPADFRTLSRLLETTRPDENSHLLEKKN